MDGVIAPAVAEPVEIEITPSRGRRLVDFAELWRYRELIGVLALRDLRLRYKETFLGAAWAVLPPLFAAVIFTVVFGRLAKLPSDGYPYSVFVLSGLLPWTFFANSAAAAGMSLVGSSHLVSKVYFPRLIIPLAAMCVPIVDLAVSAVFLLIWMRVKGVPLTPAIFLAPLALIGLGIVAAACGLGLSALTVAYRDVRNVTPFLLQFWMYATPVVYPARLFPARWRWVLYLNPMAGAVDGFRSAFLGAPLDARRVAVSAAIAAAALAAGIVYFGRVERRFADIV